MMSEAYTPPEGWRVRRDSENAMPGDAFTHSKSGEVWNAHDGPVTLSIRLCSSVLTDYGPLVKTLREMYMPNGGFVITRWYWWE